MTIEHDVAAAANPRDAMLVIARALDTILERAESQLAERDHSWGDWDQPREAAPERSEAWHEVAAELAASNGGGVEIIQGKDVTDIVLPKVSPRKWGSRHGFAQQTLKLSEYLPDDGTDWADVYAKGGPLWLYHGNRELLMSYPDSVRAAMVADVIEDDPKAAHEMGRDVLKEACNEYDPNSPAMRVDEGVAPAKVVP